MMPKTTQNLFKNLFSNIIQKTILFTTSFFSKKVSNIPFENSYRSFLAYKSSKSFKKTFLSLLRTEKTVKIKGAPPKAYYSLNISIY
jgi:hypothetical protein